MKSHTRKQLTGKWKEIYVFLVGKKVPMFKIRMTILSLFMSHEDIGFLFGHSRTNVSKILKSVWVELYYKSNEEFYLAMARLPKIDNAQVPKYLEMQVKLICGNIDGAKALEIVKDELETLTKEQASSKAMFVLQASLTFCEEGYLFL